MEPSGTTHAERTIKLILGSTLLTVAVPDGVEWLMMVMVLIRGGGGRGEDLKTMVPCIAHQEMVGEGLKAKACWVLEFTQLIAFTSHRVEVLQVYAIEDLDAMAQLSFVDRGTDKHRNISWISVKWGKLFWVAWLCLVGRFGCCS